MKFVLENVVESMESEPNKQPQQIPKSFSYFLFFSLKLFSVISFCILFCFPPFRVST